MTHVSTELKYMHTFLKKKDALFKSSKHLNLLMVVEQYLHHGHPSCLSAILHYVEGIEMKFIYRKELWIDLKKLIKNYELHPASTLMSLLQKLTSQNSIVGRIDYKKSVSRPFLIKGLEFDHAVVLDADALKKTQLYVALTRGSKQLTILADNATLICK
jgi:hypothetical protein